MEANKQLSIVIPTYNRADFLDYSLEVHIPMVKKYNIQIFVSDNASTDNTSEIMKKWIDKYTFLYYSRNETNVGPDINFEKALNLPDTEYIWLLGDTYKLPFNGIQHVLSLLQDKDKKLDAIVLNLGNTLKYPPKYYNDANELLDNLGAIMTCLSVLIYHKNLIENASFERYQNSYFIQTGIIFEYIANKPFEIQWLPMEEVTSLNIKNIVKSSWYETSKLFDYGSEKWSNFIFSLPTKYTLKTKIKVISDFNTITPHFGIINLLKLRLNTELNYSLYNKYRYSLALVLTKKHYLIFIVSIFPIFILKLTYKVYKYLKSLKGKS